MKVDKQLLMTLVEEEIRKRGLAGIPTPETIARKKRQERTSQPRWMICERS